MAHYNGWATNRNGLFPQYLAKPFLSHCYYNYRYYYCCSDSRRKVHTHYFELSHIVRVLIVVVFAGAWRLQSRTTRVDGSIWSASAQRPGALIRRRAAPNGGPRAGLVGKLQLCVYAREISRLFDWRKSRQLALTTHRATITTSRGPARTFITMLLVIIITIVGDLHEKCPRLSLNIATWNFWIKVNKRERGKKGRTCNANSATFWLHAASLSNFACWPKTVR